MNHGCVNISREDDNGRTGSMFNVSPMTIGMVESLESKPAVVADANKYPYGMFINPAGYDCIRRRSGQRVFKTS